MPEDVPEDVVTTLHPQGKQNKPVYKPVYDMFKGAIMTVLEGQQLTHTELVEQVGRQLADTFSGNVDWHTITVKLDLEARGILERTRSTPQRYRLKLS